MTIKRISSAAILITLAVAVGCDMLPAGLLAPLLPDTTHKITIQVVGMGEVVADGPLEEVRYGTRVTFHPVPAEGWNFVRWEDAVNSTDVVISLFVQYDFTLTAVMEQLPDPPSDFDGDGIPDVDDNCPVRANPDQRDSDLDGVGDACAFELDSDGDGVDDAVDNCILLPNSDQIDMNTNGFGDACENFTSVAYGELAIVDKVGNRFLILNDHFMYQLNSSSNDGWEIGDKVDYVVSAVLANRTHPASARVMGFGRLMGQSKIAQRATSGEYLELENGMLLHIVQRDWVQARIWNPKAPVIISQYKPNEFVISHSDIQGWAFGKVVERD